MAGPSHAGPEVDADFAATFRAHYQDLYRYAVRRCASTQDAEDLVAETFAVAWRRREDLPPRDEVRLWLFGTARLLRMNLHRATTRRQRLAARLGMERVGDHQPEVVTQVGDEGLARALRALTDDDREVLLLTAWEGLDGSEVATVLGVSHAAARKRLERARTRLRTHLATDRSPCAASTTTTTAMEASR